MPKDVCRTYRCRIYPTKEQKKKIDTTIACCRYVYNAMLARNRKVYERRGGHLSYIDMQDLLPKMKGYLPWLRDADSQALKDACRKVDTAYKNFFKKRAGYPKFHSKRSSRQGYKTTHASSIRVEKRKMKIPCLGWVKTKDDRDLCGKILYASIIRENGKYYACVAYDTTRPDRKALTDESQVVGLDYSSDRIFVTSNGDAGTAPRFYRNAQKTLKKRQRQLARKEGYRKGEKKSKRFCRQNALIKKEYEKIKNQRRDFDHKLAKGMADRYDFVFAEDLDLKAISNKGFGNGKATMDNGFGMFRSMLAYKLEDKGGALVLVDRFYPSSQLCSVCGHKEPSVKDLRVRDWTCPSCGTHHDRDVNAAVNILKEGLRIIEAA
ncbi:MAG: RNA-guided endonuclease InsQ/TnpB family protein [Anaerovoracaceae bacterium]